MLINKLIRQFVSPKILTNTLYCMAAQKAKKPQQGKKAEKKEDKAKPKQGAQKKTGAKTNNQQSEVEDTKKQQDQILNSIVFTSKTKVGAFYRDTIRRVHVKQSTQRGNFSQQNLLHMVSVATAQDVQLVFEAYFNYLGHFTTISNKTVDALLNKTINLALKRASLVQLASTRVFQVLKNHQYLGYFPHYEITRKAAKLASQSNKFLLFVNMLNQKLLIKLDIETVKALFHQPKNWKEFMTFTRTICYRFNRGLINNLTKQQLLSCIVSGAKRMKSIQRAQSHKQYNQFLESFENPSIQLAIAWAIINDKAEKAAQTLKKIKQDEPRIKQFTNMVLKLEQGKKQTNLKGRLQGLLSRSQHKNLFR